MGFPVGCAEVFVPKFTIHILSLLCFLRTTISAVLRFMGLSDFLEPDTLHHHHHHYENTASTRSETPPLSAVLTREFLPVVKFADLGDSPESCAVCLYDLEKMEEIRWLTNCKHIFHRSCLDRWMDHDQSTCPLCRTPFLPRGCQDEYRKRLWAASHLSELHGDDLIAGF